MKIVVRLLLFLAAFGIIATTTGAARAPESVPSAHASTAAAAAGSTTVTGEGWSKPAFPVTCVYYNPRASCGAEDPEKNTAEQCFTGVKYKSETITVCTTYAANVKEIKRANGTELKLDYQCQFGDALCIALESAARGQASMITGGISWAFGNTSFNTDSYLWDTAMGEWAWWQGAVLLIILIAGIWGITEGLIHQDRAEALGAFVRLCLAFPVSVGSVWLIGNLLNVVDGFVLPLLERGGGGEGLYLTLQNMLYGGGGGNMFLASLVLLFLVAGVMVLVLVFSFRNFSLAALIAIGPIAYMLFPMRIGRQWITNYWAAVLALLLTTPLTIGLLMLILNGVGKVDSMWSIQAFPLGIGMIMIAVAPMAAFSLFSFAGQAAGDAIGSRMGSSTTRGASMGAGKVGSLAQRSTAVRSRAKSISSGSSSASSSASSAPAQSATSRATGSTGPSASSGRRPSTPPPAMRPKNSPPQSNPSGPTNRGARS